MQADKSASQRTSFPPWITVKNLPTLCLQSLASLNDPSQIFFPKHGMGHIPKPAVERHCMPTQHRDSLLSHTPFQQSDGKCLSSLLLGRSPCSPWLPGTVTAHCSLLPAEFFALAPVSLFLNLKLLSTTHFTIKILLKAYLKHSFLWFPFWMQSCPGPYTHRVLVLQLCSNSSCSVLGGVFVSLSYYSQGSRGQRLCLSSFWWDLRALHKVGGDPWRPDRHAFHLQLSLASVV